MALALRYKDVKAACAKALGSCEDDAKLLDYVNRATERLLYKGKFKGTVQTFRFCVNSDSCIIWPREIETPEAVAVCKHPVAMRSEWYEFTEGVGQIDSDDNLCNTLIDRGEVPAFDEVVGEDKKLAVYSQLNEGVGKYINLQFFDEFGQWVTSEFDGERIDGENIAIPHTAGTYNYTTNVCKPGGLVRVKKDVTIGQVHLYEYDTTTTDLRPLAYYQADEEVPLYRRSLIPDLNVNSCDQTQLTVAAKLRFIPARDDESFLMISHKEALRLAVRAIFLEEQGIWDEANINWAAAWQALNEQLSHYKGSGEIPVPRFAPKTIWGGTSLAIQ